MLDVATSTPRNIRKAHLPQCRWCAVLAGTRRMIEIHFEMDGSNLMDVKSRSPGLRNRGFEISLCKGINTADPWTCTLDSPQSTAATHWQPTDAELLGDHPKLVHFEPRGQKWSVRRDREKGTSLLTTTSRGAASSETGSQVQLDTSRGQLIRRVSKK